jgi:hypothetical protein
MTIDFGQTSFAHSRANPTTDAAYSCAGTFGYPRERLF